MKLISVLTLILISKVKSFPFKPLDTSHPSLIDTFLQNWNKQEHFDAFMQKRMNFFH